MENKISDLFTFSPLMDDLREEGVPTVWLITEFRGEYETSYNRSIAVVNTKKEARDVIERLYEGRKPIIPKKIFKEAEKRFGKEIYRLSKTDITNEELDDFQCSPETYYHSVYPDYSLEDWQHDIGIEEDYDFVGYYAEEINYYNKI